MSAFLVSKISGTSPVVLDLADAAGDTSTIKTGTGKPSTAKPGKAEEAARQFESLMIAQMLRTARESGSSGFGGGGLEGDDTGGEEDSESSTMLDLAGQQFAQMLAQNGGIGLTHLVVNGLNKSR